jgi:endonuclease YncB( thermonuclease family)
LLLGVAVLTAPPAPAAPRDVAAAALAALPKTEGGTVTQILDGATLVLESGLNVRLAGIEPVLAAPGGTTRWEDAARMALQSLVAGHRVDLRGAATAPDRYGRVVADLVRDDGVWIEAALLDAGAARVQAPTPALAASMLRHEARARRRHLGLWQSSFYAIRAPAQLGHDSGGFVVVEARIGTVVDRHGVIWLDLGDGAAARIDRPARHVFETTGRDPLKLTGKTLRLRGWVHWQGRPILEVAAPTDIETAHTRRRRRS